MRLVDVVRDRLEQFLDERATHLGTIAEDLERFNDLLREKGLPPIGRIIAD